MTVGKLRGNYRS